MYTKWWITWCD